MKVPTGICSECGYTIRLRKDGTVQRHDLFIGYWNDKSWCKGGLKPPSPAPESEKETG
jgi:hypothetical protein